MLPIPALCRAFGGPTVFGPGVVRLRVLDPGWAGVGGPVVALVPRAAGGQAGVGQDRCAAVGCGVLGVGWGQGVHVLTCRVNGAVDRALRRALAVLLRLAQVVGYSNFYRKNNLLSLHKIKFIHVWDFLIYFRSVNKFVMKRTFFKSEIKILFNNGSQTHGPGGPPVYAGFRFVQHNCNGRILPSSSFCLIRCFIFRGVHIFIVHGMYIYTWHNVVSLTPLKTKHLIKQNERLAKNSEIAIMVGTKTSIHMYRVWEPLI